MVVAAVLWGRQKRGTSAPPRAWLVGAHSYGAAGAGKRESISTSGGVSGGNSGPGSSASSASSMAQGGWAVYADSMPCPSPRALLAAIKKDVLA